MEHHIKHFIYIILVFNLVIISETSIAVNTLSVAGPSNDTYQKTADKTNDKLNNYFQSDEHIAVYNSHVEIEFGYFHAYQPQVLIEHAHGSNNGQAIHWGSQWIQDPPHSNEPLWASRWRLNHYNANKGGIAHSSAPFSVMVLCSCEIMKDTPDTETYKDVFTEYKPWMMIGNKESPSPILDNIFAVEFSYLISEKKKSYLFSWISAAFKADCYKDNDNNNQDTWFMHQMTMIFQSTTNGLDHYSPYDCYRKITNKHDYEGTTLSTSSKTLIYDHSNHKGTSNGGYIVFHGVINDDLDELTKSCTITITVKKENGQGGYTVIHTEDFTGVKNRKIDLYNNNIEYYAGSDVCTIYVNPDDMDNLPNNKLYATIKFSSSTANNIMINRCEFMEIGM